MKKKNIFPDEENAHLTVERFKEINGRLSAKQEKILRAISSHSRFLGNSIIRNPATLSGLADKKSLGEEKTLLSHASSLDLIVGNSQDSEQLSERLKEYKYSELCRIIYREILGLCPFRRTLEEISDLAIAVVRAVLDFYRSRIEGGSEFEFVVLGMGKLGGRLLNLSSDIDLVYLYRTECHAEQIFKLCTSVTRTISSVSAGGFLYRVDLGLRPGGAMSPIAVSVDGAIDHYYHWAETWERAVLLKAAPIAGNLELGREFLEEIEPVIYHKFLDYESIEDLKVMKVRLEGVRKENDVKLGRGGIRDIEFFVQATQLMSGGAVKRLRGLINTIDALEVMAATGFITEDVRQEMECCYIFLREVEHSVQLWDELQTHSIPSEEISLGRLSKRMGFEKAEDFRAAYEKMTSLVVKNYRNLFFDPGIEVEEKGKEFWEVADFIAEGNINHEDAVLTLSNLGFSVPGDAIEIISRLVDPRRAGLTERGRILSKKVVPAFLSDIIALKNPDSALMNLDKFITGLGSKMSVYSLLSENSEIISLLSKLFSRGGMLSDFLIRHPEYLDSIILKNVTRFYDSENALREALSDAVSREEFFEDKLNALRSFKHIESLKLCFRELSEDLDPVYVGKYLSMVADVVMDSSLELARNSLKCSRGQRKLLDNMVVLGLGKLGGWEMSYASDLDIIFIYEGEDHELFSKCGQRFISNLSVYTSESFCYKVDLELRPSGKSGALVSSLEVFEEYHKTSAQIWEKQALVKARAVAGNRALGEKVMKVIEDFVYSNKLPPDFREEIYRLRGRIEKELASETESRFNLKTGRGGLVDIEFLVQMLQLAYGGENPELRTVNTMEAIRSLGRCGLIKSTESETLAGGYLFLRRMGNMLSLLNERAKNEITQDDFERMAVEFGFGGKGDFLKDEYMCVTEDIRQIHDKYFSGSF
ncbi:MAG: bifunctional [glutamate--ammonia ligase]-adenylyl-L-tyrosine phosphorylase/[glutamate--ammonia-ligase] adenylyltransferase [Candidatus Dadabacteria bacterium]|nr:bifunctional [glutamate--ammonia ligase]-adenylyl-L-tyrosine phosphorylase/[glutamate--ammonia-ligase] adenylyltransferase [Candidatus Dadabacteria bacterium]